MAVNTILLRDLVEQRLGVRWSDWSQRHPQLAEAIDRVRLVEMTVSELERDPAFSEAMANAVVDERALRAALDLVSRVERVVGRLLL